MKRRKFLRCTRLIVTGIIVLALATATGVFAQNNGNGSSQSNVIGNLKVGCTIGGKTLKSCTAGQLKQAAREAARLNASPQQKGVAVTFAGVSPATAALSPLAPMTSLGAGSTVAALASIGPPDYFGVGNYANSPFPTATGGAIAPGTGMRKFVDALPGFCTTGTTNGGANGLSQCIPIAVPDTATFGGSDFYRIGIKEYNKQMHSDLPGPLNLTNPGPGTNLRGYIQLDSTNSIPAGATPQYLGPLILATRNRPVRVLFNNMLSTNLNVPVDTTYMGAGAVSDGINAVATTSEKRAVLHLHGGNTPWISDGTPHQWITPAGGDGQPGAVGFQKGFSFQNVPDMLSLVPNTLADGMGTDYWTNQQSGRLMFYHEHAYGTTRLGVYNGLAAGYLLVDPIQESALAAATAPGTIVTDSTTGAIVSADLAHVIPLVIQDKTFVPPATQLAAQDPTWDGSRGGYGDLWFPHVYTPNQNPADITGANGYGRWDWGPWFFPPQTPASLLLQAYQCSSAAYTVANPPAFPPLMCPGVPDPTRPAPANSPSGTPEAFMDTPVVNGTAYPTLTVDPVAYRFQVLNAGNDRSLNLGLYVAEPVTLSVIITNPGANYTAPVLTFSCAGAAATATVGNGIFGGVAFTNGIIGIDMTTQPLAGCTNPTVTITDSALTGNGALASAVMSTNTEVRMVPAVPVASRPATLPNCPTSQEPTMWGGGQITALLNITGNPLNGTGLPAGCWPLYNSVAGFTAGTMGEKGTLSWGNSDSRIGGVPDPTFAGPPIIQMAAEGGLLPQLAVIPSTPVSFDYNKRSITVLNVLNHGLWLGPAERADIIVDFSAALPLCTAKGINPCTLILYNDAPAPVPAGDPRLDYFTNDPDQSSTGGAPSTIAGYGPNMRTIMQITVNATVLGPAPVASFSLPTLAAAIPAIFAATQDLPIVQEPAYPAGYGQGPATYIPIQNTSINAWIGGPIGPLTMTSGGAGYTVVPNVNFTGGGGTGAQAVAVLSPAAVASVILSNTGGFGYTTAPAVTLSGGGGTLAAATATLGAGGVRSITITNQGSGYKTAPTVLIGPPPVGGVQATATATVQATGQRRVTAITVTNPGSGYLTAPPVSFSGGGGTLAAATANLGYRVVGFTVNPGGSGYTSAPSVAVAAPATSNCVPASLCTAATATSVLAPRSVASITVTNGGTGYSSAPTVVVDPPQTVGSTATATVAAPTVPLQPKTIQELFTLDYGRMNATLGVEVPFTNFLTQTTIPYGYADPPTEIFKDGETQLWKITHNGVDTHFIHFHLFTVQVINRVGWDGAIKPPDPYELGMKDTVRMNPLEDIIIALRPFKQNLTFAVPNNNRPMDVTHPVGYQSTMTFTNVDPANNPATVTNAKINFGWEYVWHCHILGHEENDMMRAMILAVAPAKPTAVTATTGTSKGTINLSMTTLAGTPNVADPTGFTIQRAMSSTGPWTTVGTVPPTIVGTSASATFTDTGLTSKTTYFYQVVSSNLVGDTAVYATPAIGYPNVSADSAPVTTSAVAR